MRQILYMIAKMDKLAQLIQLFTARFDLARWAWVAVALALVASACGPERAQAPAPSPGVVEVEPVAPHPAAQELVPEFGGVKAHPLAEWTYAESLEEIHAVWLERFALGAAPGGDPKAIWPYVDAVLIDGDSWGMASDTTRLIYVKPDGHAYQRAGAAQPVVNAGAATPITAEALAGLGWAKAQANPALQRFDEVPGFRVAGPVRADQSCLTCHDYGLDQVVALLVYDFQEIPDD